jgi:hypothetical protein
MASQKMCFVIMPFGGKYSGYYRTIYRPALEAAGLEPRRADTDPGLSGRNLNVAYEVGYAHAKRKPVVMITRSVMEPHLSKRETVDRPISPAEVMVIQVMLEGAAVAPEYSRLNTNLNTLRVVRARSIYR